MVDEAPKLTAEEVEEEEEEEDDEAAPDVKTPDEEEEDDDAAEGEPGALVPLFPLLPSTSSMPMPPLLRVLIADGSCRLTPKGNPPFMLMAWPSGRSMGSRSAWWWSHIDPPCPCPCITP